MSEHNGYQPLEASQDGKEILKYALQMQGIDFGNMIARNTFVRLVINPLMDSVLPKLKADHVVDSETRYTVKMIIESEREVEIQ